MGYTTPICDAARRSSFFRPSPHHHRSHFRLDGPRVMHLSRHFPRALRPFSHARASCVGTDRGASLDFEAMMAVMRRRKKKKKKRGKCKREGLCSLPQTLVNKARYEGAWREMFALEEWRLSLRILIDEFSVLSGWLFFSWEFWEVGDLRSVCVKILEADPICGRESCLSRYLSFMSLEFLSEY